jgi:hypothetical protein
VSTLTTRALERRMFVETAYKHSVSEEEMYCKAHPTDRLLLLSKETYVKKYMRKT